MTYGALAAGFMRILRLTATSASETFADNMFGMASIAETNVTW